MKTEETIYKVPVYYEMCEYVYVKADSPEQAKDYVDEHRFKIPIHPENADYVEDSFETDDDVDAAEYITEEVIRGYDDKKVLIVGKPNGYTYYDATR